MNLFPIKKPNVALSISEEALYLIEAKSSRRKTTLQQVKKVSLPSGVIHLSSVKPNIEKIDIFVEQLRILAESITKPISIAISLPDLCARTSVFNFSTFPTKKSEQIALLNWRFQQDLKLDTAQSRLAYEVYVPTSLTKTSQNENPENVQVLGTAIRNEIVEQIESACLAARLLPASISISGLDIFDFYQENIQHILEVEERRSLDTSSGVMFLFMSHWGFTFLAFNEGCPIFIRTKAIGIRPNVGRNNLALSPTEQDSEENFPDFSTAQSQLELKSHALDDSERIISPYPTYTITKVEKEVLATLQYYVENFLQNEETHSPMNLFFVTDLEHGHMLLPSSQHIQQTAKVSGLKAPPIQLTQFSYSTHFNAQDCHSLQESTIWSALPGYASLRRA